MNEPAPHRIGRPSPLVFHLSAGLQSLHQALLAAPSARSPDFPWAEGLAENAAAWLAAPDPTALATEAADRLSQTMRGITAWQAHPYRRQVNAPGAVWQNGSTKLLDYGACREATEDDGPPVLVIPSLINRAYILDLHTERSLLRYLAAQGLRVFLLDWGIPGPNEVNFSLSDYAAIRLLPALAFIRGATGRNVALLGYCMGGTIAAAFAAGAQGGVSGGVSALATIGAPYAYSDTRGMAGVLRQAARSMGAPAIRQILEAQANAFGFIPFEFFQYLFAALNPVQASIKFRRFAAMDPDSFEARYFVALEDWLADAVPMSLAAATDALVDWQVEDALARGTWRFMGQPVDMGRIEVPALIVTGLNDHIAPPASSEPLAVAIPGAECLKISSGHVGMIAGSRAQDLVWRPLARFLLKHAG